MEGIKSTNELGRVQRSLKKLKSTDDVFYFYVLAQGLETTHYISRSSDISTFKIINTAAIPVFIREFTASDPNTCSISIQSGGATIADESLQSSPIIRNIYTEASNTIFSIAGFGGERSALREYIVKIEASNLDSIPNFYNATIKKL